MSAITEMKERADKHDIGGCWEEANWEVQYDKEIFLSPPDKPCKHCDVENGKLPICPRVVVAWNEGGYNCTGVCLDCILEAYGSKNAGASPE